MSHSSYPAPYPPNIDSSITLHGLSSNQRISIIFYSFDLSTTHSCSSNYLSIQGLAGSKWYSNCVGSNSHYTSPPLNVPITFFSNGASVQFKFKTNAFSTGAGIGFFFKYEGEWLRSCIRLLDKSRG